MQLDPLQITCLLVLCVAFIDHNVIYSPQFAMHSEWEKEIGVQHKHDVTERNKCRLAHLFPLYIAGRHWNTFEMKGRIPLSIHHGIYSGSAILREILEAWQSDLKCKSQSAV